MSGNDQTRTGTYQSAFARGEQIGSGRFTLMRPLGRGGMGEVWLAQDVRLHESVALKFLPQAIRGDATALDDLWRETARSHKLTHPHVVRIHDLHEDGPVLAYIAMEYVDGPTLAGMQLQQPNRLLKWDFLKPLVLQLCEALEYAHGQKIIHRDLKPSNIMVDSRGSVKLADFGIAATVTDSMSRVSLRHATSGTMLYMSPQQMNGEKPRPTDDIYALGATLYELLTSKPPFHTGDIAHQVRNVPALPLAERLAEFELTNDVPESISALINSCLAKDAAQRPQSARAFADRVQGLAPDTEFLHRTLENTAPTTTLGDAPLPRGIKTIQGTDATATAPSNPRPTPVAASVAASAQSRTRQILAGVGLILIAWLIWYASGHSRQQPIFKTPPPDDAVTKKASAEVPPPGAGNFWRALKTDAFDFTSPVGSFAANRNGLLDIKHRSADIKVRKKGESLKITSNIEVLPHGQ